MIRLLTVFCAMVLVLGLATSAYAEVQNVKVSGEVTVRGIYRSTYDLDDNDNNTSDSDNPDGVSDSTSSTGSSESDSFFASQIRVRVDADLTDNVSAQIELANQRDWDDTDFGLSETGSSNEEFVVGVNLANITLKEAFYTPLSVTVGRQALWFGDGFIVGLKQRDPEDSLSADEFTLFDNFDAIRATLDFDPITIDLVYSKIDEDDGPGDVIDERDEDFYFANVGYQFANYNAEAEAYLGLLKDRSAGVTGGGQSDDIWVLGVRGSLEPMENLVLRAEVATQFGDLGNTNRDRKAWAADVRGEYTLADAFWTPTIGGEFVFYSGEEVAGDDPTGGAGDYEGWDPIFRGHFHSAIREFQGVFYSTDEPSDSSGATNELQLIADVELHPADNMTLVARYLHFVFDEEPVASRDDQIGDEIDIQLVYDYTEDVTMSLITAWFFPGDFYGSALIAESSSGTRSDDGAFEVVGSLSVAF